jgi:fructokinase
MSLYCAIEAGGTTWVAATVKKGDDLANFVERIEVPTRDPESTIGEIKEWFKGKVGDVCSVGIASFGPIDPRTSSPTFGFITSTPKPGWNNTDVIGLLGFRDEYSHIPFKFDTDVNAPAVAEYMMHRVPGSSSSAYVTVGTGVGVGLVINGLPVHGMLHPEGGHIQVGKMPGDAAEGVCPFHKGTCVEGMVCTKALAARAGVPASDLATLPDDHEVWDACAFYLAQLVMSLTLLCSPERIVFGGGVFNRTILYGKIREQTQILLNGYIQHPNVTTAEGLEKYICASHWGQSAGIVGAAYLAQIADEQR